jgi:hypothetical protein
MEHEFAVLLPDMQIAFHYRLQTIRDVYLQEALGATVEKLDLRSVDEQLSQYVRPEALSRVASFGLRGEIFFPVPAVLAANPFLLGYYRLLYGLSQKEFYSKGPFGMFVRLEDAGQVPDKAQQHISALCRSMAQTGEVLVAGVGTLSLTLVHDLQLLTVGAFLRGSENTRIGQAATRDVFDAIREIVEPHITHATARTLSLENASGRVVLVEFASDPDISISEVLGSGARPLVSIEIKGGTDASNIHNRLGEAEKSHQKARQRGFFEFWTIVRVDVDREHAARETPTTSHFFHIDRVRDAAGSEHRLFRDLLCSIIGITTDGK